MEIAETVRKIFQEMIVPELGRIREENKKIVAILELTNKRLDDVSAHLADQSRRIDELRSELSQRIEDVRSELSQRIEDVRSELSQRIDDTNKRIDDTTMRVDDMNKRIDDTNMRIDELRSDLTKRMDNMHADLVRRIDSNNERIDRFFLTAATKEAQAGMERRLTYLEREMGEIKQRLAA